MKYTDSLVVFAVASFLSTGLALPVPNSSVLPVAQFLPAKAKMSPALKGAKSPAKSQSAVSPAPRFPSANTSPASTPATEDERQKKIKLDMRDGVMSHPLKEAQVSEKFAKALEQKVPERFKRYVSLTRKAGQWFVTAASASIKNIKKWAEENPENAQLLKEFGTELVNLAQDLAKQETRPAALTKLGEKAFQTAAQWKQ